LVCIPDQQGNLFPLPTGQASLPLDCDDSSPAQGTLDLSYLQNISAGKNIGGLG